MSTDKPPAEPRVHEFVARVVVARPRHELFAFWRDFTNAPKFMANVAGVTAVDSLSSVWTVTAPAGGSTEWEMLVTDEEADRVIAWSTSGNTPVSYSGRIEFEDAAVPTAAVPSAAVPSAAVHGATAQGATAQGATTQDTTGSVGTQVTATVRHEVHAGLVETLIEAVAGSHEAAEPPVQSSADLKRFKEYMEGRIAQASSGNA